MKSTRAGAGPATARLSPAATVAHRTTAVAAVAVLAAGVVGLIVDSGSSSAHAAPVGTAAGRQVTPAAGSARSASGAKASTPASAGVSGRAARPAARTTSHTGRTAASGRTSSASHAPSAASSAKTAASSAKTSTTAAKTSTTAAKTSTLPAGTTAGPFPGSFVVTVQSGETLSGIAQWFTTNGYEAIFQANEAELGPNPNFILPGEKIVVSPKTATMAVIPDMAP